MYCMNCGRPLERGARACARCGAAVPAPPPDRTQVLPGADRPAAGGQDPGQHGAAGAPGSEGTAPGWTGSGGPGRGGPAEAAAAYQASAYPTGTYGGSGPVIGTTGRPTEPPRPPRAPLVAAAVLLVAALGGAGWLVGTGGSDPAPRTPGPAASASPSPRASASPSATPTPTTDPETLSQARALDALLDRTEASRGSVVPAVAALQSCTTSPAEAQAVFEEAATGRRTLLGELDGLDLDAVPGSGDLRTVLAEALQGSAEADDAFAAWAAGQAGGCVPDPADPDLVEGLRLSAEVARPAKEQFVARWNPLAERYDLPARDASAL